MSEERPHKRRIVFDRIELFSDALLQREYASQGFPPPQKEDQKQQQKLKQRQNRGGAVQLLVKLNVQLQLSELLC